MTSTAASSSPKASRRPLTTAVGITEGAPIRERSRRSSYSLYATLSPISLTAITLSERLTKRTTWREMPRGSAARISVGQSSRGRSQGKSSSAGSTVAAVISSVEGMGMALLSHSLHDRARGPQPCGCGPRVSRLNDQKLLITRADDRRWMQRSCAAVQP